MRLINTGTMDLEEFMGEPPEYSILSHCWGSDEVSLQDHMGGKRHGKGYDKVSQCCRVSRLEGYRYTWIDTCCIDKTSSSELSEAINSMFQWYVNAAICYAYLEDVEDVPNESSFARSRWFTRGWTLQELVAPPVVVFLNSAWKEIGTRSTLKLTISKITGIEDSILDSTLTWKGHDLGIGQPLAHRVPMRPTVQGMHSRFREFSTAQKMAWAAGRETTRLEDQAYCLMGLFEVNMPLIYGEGDKAFFRLQREILNASDDSSIFAWELPEKEFSDRGHIKTELLALSPNWFQHSGSIRCTTEAGTSNQAFEMAKTSIQLRVPVIGRNKSTGKWNGSPLGLTEGSLVWYSVSSELPDAPKMAWEDLGNFLVQKWLDEAVHSIEVLGCASNFGTVGLLLGVDKKGQTTRRHIRGLVHFDAQPKEKRASTATISLPARALDVTETRGGLAWRLRSYLTVKASGTFGVSLEGSGYALAEIHRSLDGSPNQTTLGRVVAGSWVLGGRAGYWRACVFEHEQPEEWPAFLVFFYYTDTDHLLLGCVAGTVENLHNRLAIAVRPPVDWPSVGTCDSTSASELRATLIQGREAVLKVRKVYGFWQLNAFVDTPGETRIESGITGRWGSHPATGNVVQEFFMGT